MFNVNCEKNNIIPIGYEGENKVEEVQFDFSQWVQDYGSGTIILLHQRSADPAPYPVTLTTEGNVATWTLSNADTQYKGWGAAQLVYTVGEAIKKSVVYRTYNNASLGDSTDPPEPWETWVEQVLQAAQDAEASAETASSAATLSQSYAVGGTGTRTGEDTDNAKYYSEEAYSSVSQAIEDNMASDEEVQEIIDNY